jgi:hypothetical protein
MKLMADVVRGHCPPLSRPDWEIEVVIRRGTTWHLPEKIKATNMKCKDCGGTTGYTCRQKGRKAWFCGNQKCLETDAKIYKLNKKILSK